MVSILCLLLLTLIAFEDGHYAVRLLTPLVHCLGCFVGIVFGLHFNHLGINAISGSLLGIVSAALIMQSISKLYCGGHAPLVMIVALVCLVTLILYLYFMTLLVRLGLWNIKWLGWCNLVIGFGSTICAFVSGDNFLAFQHMFALIDTFYSTHKLGINKRLSAFCILLTYIVTFIAMLLYAIANKNYSFAYCVGSALVLCTLFGAVGWYYNGFLAALGHFRMGFSFATLCVLDKEVAEAWRHGTGVMVLYVTCRVLGAGICSLAVYPLLLPFIELCSRWLGIMFRRFFLQSVCQLIAAEFGMQGDTVHKGLVVFVRTMMISRYMVMVSGAFLGGLCCHAMVMLTNSSNDEKITGWSLMFSGSVLGALTACSVLRLKVGVPIGAFFGCSIVAVTLLWRSGYNFKAYFQRSIPQDFVSKIGFIGWLGQKVKWWIYNSVFL